MPTESTRDASATHEPARDLSGFGTASRDAMVPLSASQRHASLLKQKTLDALTRLGDRDTARVAVHELTRLISSMPPEHIPVVLQCLCDESAAAPKPTARREVLRLFETVADAQKEHALPHLPRLVAATVRRMKDPDSIVGDACVETLGALAEFTARLPPNINRAVLSGPNAVGPHFIRPIMDAMHETNSRGAQDVACRALGRVFRRRGPGMGGADVPAGVHWYPDGGPGRLALKLAGMLHAPHFYAKEALVRAIAALFSSAAFAVGPQLPALLGVSAARADAKWRGLIGGGGSADDGATKHPGGGTDAPLGDDTVGAGDDTVGAGDDTVGAGDDTAAALKKKRVKKKCVSVDATVGERDSSARANVTVVPGGLLHATGSRDWPVRRAAAEALTVLLCDLGPGLENDTVTPVPLVDAIGRALEQRKHDKVKPARDAFLTALSVVDALRRYAAAKMPSHDIAMWRRWVRSELGEDIGSLDEEGRATAAGDRRRGAESPRARKENVGWARFEYAEDASEEDGNGRGIVEGTDGERNLERVKRIRRKKLSMAFREANIDAHASEEIIVKIPPRPRQTSREEEDAATVPVPVPVPVPMGGSKSKPLKSDEASTVQTPRGMGAEGNTYEVASSDGDDEAIEDDDAEAAIEKKHVDVEKVASAEVPADLPPTVAAETPAPSTRRPKTVSEAREREETVFETFPDASDRAGASDNDDAPEWMLVAKGLERDGGYEPLPLPRRVALPPPAPILDADDVSVLEDLEETPVEDIVMRFDPPNRASASNGPPGFGVPDENRASSRFDLDVVAREAALEDMREQMRSMAASQSQVLHRIGDFVTESCKAIETLTRRVESMENAVGAAVSSASTVASAARNMAERESSEALRLSSRAAKLSAARATEEVKLALAKDRAALEEEKAQLRIAAAQLERAASRLERVVPERNRTPEYERFD